MITYTIPNQPYQIKRIPNREIQIKQYRIRRSESGDPNQEYRIRRSESKNTESGDLNQTIPNQQLFLREVNKSKNFAN